MRLRKPLFLPFIVGIAVVLLIAAVVASVVAYQRAYSYFANDLPILANFAVAQPQPVSNATPDASDTVQLPQPWDGKERINILLMGIDQRVGDNEPAHRTDTMMVVTIDPVTMEAGILSIPRDIWVPIPGFQDPNYRINTANFLGDANDYPGGGVSLARKTVESFLGVQIHYAARINFTAFESFVDRIGGVTVDVPEDIYDAEYPTEDYRTEVFQLAKGTQTMDGETALKYARTRHSSGGDFDRARRQQQVILAVKEKLKNPQVLASLVAAAPELLVDLSTSIKTDMTLDQMQQLAVLGTRIEREKIKSEVLDQRFTEFATTPDGASVNIPVRERIAELRDSFFASTPDQAATVATPGSP